MNPRKTRYARRNGDVWTQADELLLLELRAAGESHRSIGVRLGKTTVAVTTKVGRLIAATRVLERSA